MPGPVSDSYDPEFSTGANAADVKDAVATMAKAIGESAKLGGLKDIVSVVHGASGKRIPVILTERQWRVVRFALNRALESL